MSYQPKFKIKNIKKVGKLILGRKKTKEEREEEENNLRKRAHFVNRQGGKGPQEEFVVGNDEDESFQQMQNNYYKEREANRMDGGNFDMKRYQSVNAEKFRATQTDDF